MRFFRTVASVPYLKSYFYSGLEDFEEKLDQMETKEGEKEEEGGSWLTNVVSEFLRVKQETEAEMNEASKRFLPLNLFLSCKLIFS